MADKVEGPDVRSVLADALGAVKAASSLEELRAATNAATGKKG